MMKGQLFHYLLFLLCLSLFTYEFVKALLTYYEGEIVTKTAQKKQQDFHRPVICISSKYLMRQNETKILLGENFTHADYQRGKWTADNSTLTEEQILDKIAPRLSDLLKDITIRKTTNATGSDYKAI